MAEVTIVLTVDDVAAEDLEHMLDAPGVHPRADIADAVWLVLNPIQKGRRQPPYFDVEVKSLRVER